MNNDNPYNAEDYPAPKEAKIPVSDTAVQRLFDSLWLQGLRPTGFKVVMESAPEPFPEELKKQMADIASELTEVTGYKHYFEEYWGMGSTCAVLWKEITSPEDVSSLESEPVEEFDSINSIMVYVQNYYATDGDASTLSGGV